MEILHTMAGAQYMLNIHVNHRTSVTDTATSLPHIPGAREDIPQVLSPPVSESFQGPRCVHKLRGLPAFRTLTY